jgi:hypothetical protein
VAEAPWTRSLDTPPIPHRTGSGIVTPGWHLCSDCKHHDFYYNPEAADTSEPQEHMCYSPQVWQPRPDQLVTGAHIATRCVDGRAGLCGIEGKYFFAAVEFGEPVEHHRDVNSEDINTSMGYTSPPPPTIPWYRRWFSV